ncbi:MAG: HAD family hydrolase [Treponema sp.]|nr:HAD family hydrolase [Treponema sp.]
MEGVVFDLDGTLLNTLDDIADSCNYALEQYGFPKRTIDEVRNFVGNGLGVLMEKAVPDGRQNPDYEAALDAMHKIYAENCLVKTGPYDGILPMLEKISSSGIKCAIVSNKPDEQVKELSKIFFSKYIEVEVSVGEKESAGIRRKPAPDSVLAILEKWKIQKDKVVYVGDSDVDILTAKNAGLECISASWGFRSRDFLIEHGAVCIADSPEEVAAIVMV